MIEETMEEQVKWVEGLLTQFGNSRTSLIPILQAVQAKYRYLPQNVMTEISTQLGLPLSSIYGVATFYAQFSTEPKGRHILQICDGTACHVRGAKELIERIRKDFGLSEEKNTTDDKFLTLETVACIGACAMAPALIADGHIYGQVKVDKLLEIVKELKEGDVQ
ncbi:MAG TPA: NAD(P)H-dependent oxidoreductase subunit E [Candidatus Cloacimonadota bacterium]|jgi:NADH:ubiquinone oxidoreductase subunit E|nr:NAD(P)H-dependent oxidoreductase subunit E [Candidatus Cloacimonadales bacterium]HOE90882.1 NAD(P)H-dependent oxidoreductase subunit E [Candidatus Cloacimonadota bacterium]HPY95617.1 NAD(P)H-dependent oxidoreductase subunit E [Candidatus Cloacimonadota bacterium]HQB40185.1 NAD(P)H-dependent oxidoreductase subunit E [Candidatus Cloacimonadota bacterium]